MPVKKGINAVAQNRKARHEYFIESTYECGIALAGTEVKSIRGGKCIGGLYGGKGFAGGAYHDGVLARNIDNSFWFVLFVGAMDNHIRADSGEYYG